MRDQFLGFTIRVHHKGGNSQAEMNRANTISQQQLGIMQQQLGMQQQQFNQVNPTLQQIIQGGGLLPSQRAALTGIAGQENTALTGTANQLNQALTGIAGQEKAALTAQAINSLPQQYQNLLGQMNNQLAQRGITGGQFAGGGQIAQGYGQLGQALGNQQANLLTNVQMQDAANRSGIAQLYGQNMMGIEQGNAQNLFGIQQAGMSGLTNALNQSMGLGAQYGGQALGFGGQGISALGQGVTAANNADQAQTGFFGSLMGGLAGLGGAGITAFCPAAGSLILMADGSEKAIESLNPDEQVMGIDGEPCTIEDVPSELAETICVTFDDGHVTHNSLTHAFALPIGGFTVSVKSKGKRVVTSNGLSTVVSIKRDGVRRVFSILTDGSHTYRADGVWALGVGDAERHISMDEWAKIGEKLAIEINHG
jgi:hypothetical protein